MFKLCSSGQYVITTSHAHTQYTICICRKRSVKEERERERPDTSKQMEQHFYSSVCMAISSNPVWNNCRVYGQRGWGEDFYMRHTVRHHSLSQQIKMILYTLSVTCWFWRNGGDPAPKGISSITCGLRSDFGLMAVTHIQTDILHSLWVTFWLWPCGCDPHPNGYPP